MKTLKLLLALILILSISSCQYKEDIAAKQPNGLNYEFLDYIGPDSCMLYRCAYAYNTDGNAGSVFLTICKDKNSSIQYQQGKVSISNSTVIDTVIKMVPKMVPETSIVVTQKIK